MWLGHLGVDSNYIGNYLKHATNVFTLEPDVFFRLLSSYLHLMYIVLVISKLFRVIQFYQRR
jgi:hypothetical protein